MGFFFFFFFFFFFLLFRKLIELFLCWRNKYGDFFLENSLNFFIEP